LTIKEAKVNRGAGVNNYFAKMDWVVNCCLTGQHLYLTSEYFSLCDWLPHLAKTGFRYIALVGLKHPLCDVIGSRTETRQPVSFLTPPRNWEAYKPPHTCLQISSPGFLLRKAVRMKYRLIGFVFVFVVGVLPGILAVTTPIKANEADEDTTCVQVFLEIPSNIDPNLVPIDPESGRRLYLGVCDAYAGQDLVIRGRACDPNTQQTVTLYYYDSGESIPLNEHGDYTIVYQCATTGVFPLTLIVTDDHPDQKSCVGTWIVRVHTENRPPVLTLQTSTARMRLKQKALMELAKREGTHVLRRRGYVLVSQ